MIPATSAAIAAGLADSGLPYRAAMIAPMPGTLRWAVGNRATAITIGHRIFIQPDRFDDVAGGRAPELLAHELIHVEQWARLGACGFLSRYLGDYARLRLLGLSHHPAYRHIRAEWEAYSGSRDIVRRP